MSRPYARLVTHYYSLLLTTTDYYCLLGLGTVSTMPMTVLTTTYYYSLLLLTTTYYYSLLLLTTTYY